MHPFTIYVMAQQDVAERLADAETERQILRLRRARRAIRRAPATLSPVTTARPAIASGSDAAARHRLLGGITARAADAGRTDSALARAREALGRGADVAPDGTIGCRA